MSKLTSNQVKPLSQPLAPASQKCFSMRALPPSGVAITLSDIIHGFRTALQGAAAVERFRAAVKRRFNVRHCFFASSGRAALSLLLSALRQLYPERNEVLLPAFTSFSVPSAVVNAGLKVALYDLDGATLSPNLESVKETITDKTLCMVVCHLYGFPCDMDAILAMAREQGILVIDDAAQAMGATYKGQQVGTIGDAGIFSLSRGKNITAVDGGIIVTDSDILAEKLGELEPTKKAPGAIGLACNAVILSALLRPWLYWLPRSLPFLKIGASVYDPDFPVLPFAPFQAGIAIRMLGRLEQINAGRIEKALSMTRKIWGQQGGSLIRSNEGTDPVYLRLPRICTGPVQESYSLGVVRSYPLPLNEILGLKAHLVSSGSFPVAKMLAEKVVTLPTHEFVSDEDQNHMVSMNAF